jgi:hypothetical protein
MNSIFNNDVVEEYMRRKYGQDYEQNTKDAYRGQLERSNQAALLSNIGNVMAGQQVGSGNQYFDGLNKQAQGNLDKIGQERRDLVDQYLKEKYFNAQLAEKEQDRALRESLAKQGMQEKSLDRAMKMQDMERKSQEKTQKEQELSAAQAKQLGLAQMGQLSNKQYEEALSKGYDPTSYKNKLDMMTWMPQMLKSDEGKQAMAAQDTWVESYLRDASGAAIPHSERSSYAEIYFPRPGDTQEIVANKMQMRKQKEQSALIGAGPGAKQFQQIKETPQFEQNQQQSLSPEARKKRIQELRAKKVGG